MGEADVAHAIWDGDVNGFAPPLDEAPLALHDNKDAGDCFEDAGDGFMTPATEIDVRCDWPAGGCVGLATELQGAWLEQRELKL